MTVKVGIAGLGNHATRKILPAIAQSDSMAVSAIWTRDANKFDAISNQVDASFNTDFGEFLASDMDVVYLATPTGLHFSHALKILEAGHNVWAEKPIATSLEQVRKLVSVAHDRKLVLREAFMFAYHQQAAALLELLASNPVGTMKTINIRFCFPHLKPDNFRYSAELGGGAFLDHACYLTRALQIYADGNWDFLGGRIENAGYEVDTRGAALFYRQDGVFAHFDWGFGYSYVNEMEFIGETGRIIVEMPFTKPPGRSHNIVVHDSTGGSHTIDIIDEDPYASMLNTFASELGSPDKWQRSLDETVHHAEFFWGLWQKLNRA